MRPLSMEFLQSWWDLVTEDGTPMIDGDATEFELSVDVNNYFGGLVTETGLNQGPYRNVGLNYYGGIYEYTMKDGSQHGFYRFTGQENHYVYLYQEGV